MLVSVAVMVVWTEQKCTIFLTACFIQIESESDLSQLRRRHHSHKISLEISRNRTVTFLQANIKSSSFLTLRSRLQKNSKPYPLFSHPLSFLVLQIGITSSTAKARDLFAHKDLGKFTKFFSSKVNPTGLVMVKLTPVEDVFYGELRFI